MLDIIELIFADMEEVDKLWLYGDFRYHNTSGIIGAITKPPSGRLTEEEKYHNQAMARLWIVVEHGFGKVLQLWENCGYAKGLRVGSQPVGTIYMVAVLLTNIHTCLNDSQVSKIYNYILPSIESYLVNVTMNFPMSDSHENALPLPLDQSNS